MSRLKPPAARGFCKEEKTGRRAACEIDDKPYTLAGLTEHRIKNKENQFIDFRLIATKRGKTTLFPLFVNSLTGRRAAACEISPDATGR
ncbi:TPA: hypothetical protein SLN60_000088 [Serratia marcescens]|nr:hypothetical protein [Serratia marcescens]